MIPLGVIAAKGGGGGGYHASAVHFDGMTWLVNSGLVAIDSNFFSCSYWFQNTSLGTSQNMNAGLIFVVDPEGGYSTYIDNLLDEAGIQISLENVTGSSGVNTKYDIGSGNADLLWHHLLFSGETGQASPGNVCKVFVDGVDMTTALSDQGPFQMVFNGKSFWFGADNFGGGEGSGILGNIADAWIAPNVYLIDGSGTIPPAMIALFRNPATGKPVNPTGFPVGGAVLFSGNASTFATNQLGGGAFVTTGALTDASTSPSD